MGVNFGEVVEFCENRIVLKNSRKLWRWCALRGVSLEDVASFGLSSKPSKIKISGSVSLVEIPNDINLSGVIEVTPEAEKTIENAPVALEE